MNLLSLIRSFPLSHVKYKDVIDRTGGLSNFRVLRYIISHLAGLEERYTYVYEAKNEKNKLVPCIDIIVAIVELHRKIFTKLDRPETYGLINLVHFRKTKSRRNPYYLYHDGIKLYLEYINDIIDRFNVMEYYNIVIKRNRIIRINIHIPYYESYVPKIIEDKRTIEYQLPKKVNKEMPLIQQFLMEVTHRLN